MEWLSTLIGTLFTGAVTFGVCLVNNNAQMRKRDIEQDKHITEIKTELNKQIDEVKHELNRQLMELSAAYQQSAAVIGCQIAELDKKQEVHNKVIERVYKLENKTEVHDEKFKELERRQA